MFYPSAPPETNTKFGKKVREKRIDIKSFENSTNNPKETINYFEHENRTSKKLKNYNALSSFCQNCCYF